MKMVQAGRMPITDFNTAMRNAGFIAADKTDEEHSRGDRRAPVGTTLLDQEAEAAERDMEFQREQGEVESERRAQAAEEKAKEDGGPPWW